MKKKILWTLVILCLCGAVAVSAVYVLNRDFANQIITKITNKVNQAKPIEEEIIETADGKKVLMDHPKGYSLEFPASMQYDITNSPSFIKFYDEDTTAIVTREWAPYEDVSWYIEEYLNNYILNDRYIEKNNINIHENKEFTMESGAKARLISLTREPEEQLVPRQNSYTYFYVLSQTGKQAFFRVMFKSKDYEASKDKIETIIQSFREITLKGENKYKTAYKHHMPDWNKETKALYTSLLEQDEIKWGLFVDGSYKDEKRYGWFSDIEKKVDHEFDFALHYVNLSPNFPAEELQRMYDHGKITELTLQISYHANGDLFGLNPNFAVYDGLEDETIRSFARGAKAFGHPFLFRLNNEMNSDWVNYSGVAALSDPELFVENWRRIYDIFQEEGVDNAIWIFNPNAEDCPPCHWNSFTAYFPGEAYVHMIGMTGYNTGTYYADIFHEKWRTFDEIYKEPYEKYMQFYSDFPFIITEFASSSVGGDKAAWITDMFQSIVNYPNVKMALWWSSADYDMRDATYKQVARPYFLDETPETTQAFKDGLVWLEDYYKKQNKFRLKNLFGN